MTTPFVVRPVQLSDLDQVVALARAAGPGMTTLPKDKALLKKKILTSLKAFASSIDHRPHGELYFFVMEDVDTKKIVGSCAILSSIGCHDPFYAFQIKAQEKQSYSLKKKNILHTLQLHQLLRGPSELGSLFLLPDYRGRGCGRLLSLSRFLFMASHPNRFCDHVVAEMRGMSNREGVSPFYDAVGHHFLPGMSFTEADYLVGQQKAFVHELFPTTPFLIDMLPINAQNVIGKAHDETLPALRLLQLEGFRMTDLVDIMDAGPKVSVPFQDIRTIRESVEGKSFVFKKTEGLGDMSLISCGHLSDFRVTQGHAIINPRGQVVLHSSLKKILTHSTHIWTAPLFPKNKVLPQLGKIYSFPTSPLKGEVNLKQLVLKHLEKNSQSPLFLRRFAEWYKTVGTTSKTNG